MGSTACVRCGANIVPHSFCDICHDVLGFTCSSCSMNTIERTHANCYDIIAPDTNNSNNLYLQDSQKLMEKPVVTNNNYINTHFYMQNQLNDEIKDNSIKLSTSYWNNMFDAIKSVNTYWNRTFNTLATLVL